MKIHMYVMLVGVCNIINFVHTYDKVLFKLIALDIV